MGCLIMGLSKQLFCNVHYFWVKNVLRILTIELVLSGRQCFDKFVEVFWIYFRG